MVPNQEFAEPPAEWLAESGKGTPTVSRTPSVEELHAMALPLDDDQRLRLVARLWKSLPADHRAALLTLQLEEAHDERGRRETEQPKPNSNTNKPTAFEFLFDRRHTSDLYSAPRRFDLATIFVVTAAFSLMLGGLTALDSSPLTKIVISGLVVIIAAAQAYFLDAANPRGVSIVTGAIAFTFILWILFFTIHLYPDSLFLDTFIGIIGGGVLGYLLGTLVGGVFLVADMLRGKFEGRKPDEARDERALATTKTTDEYIHE